jgi:hypothetical protein
MRATCPAHLILLDLITLTIPAMKFIIIPHVVLNCNCDSEFRRWSTYERTRPLYIALVLGTSKWT